MSARIYWEPIIDGVVLNVGAPSAFIEKIKRVFGELPTALTAEDLPALKTLAKLEEISDPADNPYAALVSAIENNGSVRVWAEY